MPVYTGDCKIIMATPADESVTLKTMTKENIENSKI